MKELLIFPYNGNAIEAFECLSENYKLIGFIDDINEKHGNSCISGIKVYGREAITKYKNAEILAVPGSPNNYKSRSQIIENLGISSSRFAAIIHPNTNISSLAKIGKNILIMAGVVITSNAVISNNVIILPNSVIHHDSNIGENSIIGSNVAIAGYVNIGANCYVGSGSNIKNNVNIGDDTLIGIGSNVVNHIESGKIVFGNPAKPKPSST